TSRYIKDLESARTALKPLMDALKEQAPVLARALGDKGNVQVRLLTARAIEDIAQSRNLLQRPAGGEPAPKPPAPEIGIEQETADRKSTRLNSSHVKISYAVFCLKK